MTLFDIANVASARIEMQTPAKRNARQKSQNEGGVIVEPEYALVYTGSVLALNTTEMKTVLPGTILTLPSFKAAKWLPAHFYYQMHSR